jgi:hypothetical protein
MKHNSNNYNKCINDNQYKNINNKYINSQNNYKQKRIDNISKTTNNKHKNIKPNTITLHDFITKKSYINK